MKFTLALASLLSAAGFASAKTKHGILVCERDNGLKTFTARGPYPMLISCYPSSCNSQCTNKYKYTQTSFPGYSDFMSVRLIETTCSGNCDASLCYHSNNSYRVGARCDGSGFEALTILTEENYNKRRALRGEEVDEELEEIKSLPWKLGKDGDFTAEVEAEGGESYTLHLASDAYAELLG